YRGLLKHYGSTRDARDAVDVFLRTTLPSVYAELARTAERTVERVQATQLSSLRLGEHVAENEEESLADYFVDTASYRAVLNPATTVFVGRKGSGKTANLLEAARVLSEAPRNLACVIKPVG